MAIPLVPLRNYLLQLPCYSHRCLMPGHQIHTKWTVESAFAVDYIKTYWELVIKSSHLYNTPHRQVLGCLLTMLHATSVINLWEYSLRQVGLYPMEVLHYYSYGGVHVGLLNTLVANWTGDSFIQLPDIELYSFSATGEDSACVSILLEVPGFKTWTK